MSRADDADRIAVRYGMKPGELLDVAAHAEREGNHQILRLAEAFEALALHVDHAEKRGGARGKFPGKA